ncbi:MAG TPA: transaldolase family protein [Anaeromyxobacter sp.]|nr:transaldolase family protein [Anaeromyxobacter sp.]
MDLYLDSVDFNEIEAAFKLGFVKSLTTTPTFMHRHGITDIQGAIVKLSGMVPDLQVEALGRTHDEIVAAAHELLALPLKLEPVFKVPVSLEALRACNTLTRAGHRVNVHLIYSLNQAYMAMEAGAAFICPLAGRMHDQGQDANRLFEQIAQVKARYGYKTKIMYSSVRHAEHVRSAMLVGADVCTVPWSVLQRLCDNALTEVGANQFFEHTTLMTVRAREAIGSGGKAICGVGEPVSQALVRMTESRLGAVALVDEQGRLAGVFTDGDLRRDLQRDGPGILGRPLSQIGHSAKPLTVSADALLYEAVRIFQQHKVDNVVVVEADRPVGLLDVQDLVRMGLLG